MKSIKNIWFLFLLTLFSTSCDEDGITTYAPYNPTPAPLKIPQLFSDNIIDPVIPIDNPQTVEGISLGRKLFFDPILSGDNSQSCAD